MKATAEAARPVEAQDPYYILTETNAPDHPDTRALKQGETFAVFDPFGDIVAGGGQGLYHEGTRHLSACCFRFAGHRPFLLRSTPGASSHVLSVDLTNPDVGVNAHVKWPRGRLHLRRATFLWEGVCYMVITLTNHCQDRMDFPIELSFEADFRDLFEVRGTRRARRGQELPVHTNAAGPVFAYHGLDGIARQTIVRIEPPPRMEGEVCRLDISMAPGDQQRVYVAISCNRPVQQGRLAEHFDLALVKANTAVDTSRSSLAGVETSSDIFDEWLERSRADVSMMVTETAHGPFPYAGIPWFSTMFGRDGILTAMSLLWADPGLARGVLLSLAATQATTTDPSRDAQPGKILHEARSGEMAALREIPFGRYYGSVDATPLFVMLAGKYYDRTADRRTIERLWPHIDAALRWIDRHGDADDDGFVEYFRQTDEGLTNQGWKDSHDAIFHADGTLARGPIALCEVQGYVYAAKHHAAELAAMLGEATRARKLHKEAEELHRRFERAFWLDDLGTYAIALDGKKKPCRVVSSNAAQVLISGIAIPDHARRVADTMLREDVFSGWGIRTIREGEARYNPMSYHNGSIWPHDTALAASGFARYGLEEHVIRVAEGLFAAAQEFDLRRLPELFCGFPRQYGEPPTRYPTACAPQAWSAAAAFLVVQALLGLDVDGCRKRVTLRQPGLPSALEWIRLRRIRIGEAELDLLCERRGDDVGISVIRRVGEVRVVTEK